jgi:hypothetical protein
MPAWKIGMKVKKTFHGVQGYTEETEGVVTACDEGCDTVIVNGEHGVTYDWSGMEKEMFFPGMYSSIEALPEAPKKKKTRK